MGYDIFHVSRIRCLFLTPETDVAQCSHLDARPQHLLHAVKRQGGALTAAPRAEHREPALNRLPSNHDLVWSLFDFIRHETSYRRWHHTPKKICLKHKLLWVCMSTDCISVRRSSKYKDTHRYTFVYLYKEKIERFFKGVEDAIVYPHKVITVESTGQALQRSWYVQ